MVAVCGCVWLSVVDVCGLCVAVCGRVWQLCDGCVWLCVAECGGCVWWLCVKKPIMIQS